MLNFASLLDLRSIIVLLLSLFGFGSACGCESAPKSGQDWQQAIEGARRAGLQGRVRVIGGDGHLLGWGFNLLGTHWYVEGEFKPLDEPHGEAFDVPVATSGPVTP